MATGMAKWGMTNGTAAALMLADRLLGLDNAWAPLFDPNRVNPRASARSFVTENAQIGLALHERPTQASGSAPDRGPEAGRG